MIESSYGQLTTIASPAGAVGPFAPPGPSAYYDLHRQTYARIYQRQPAVRTVVDFFARNIAQLGLHAFRRVSDLDRRRLDGADPLVRALRQPNPGTTRYRLIETTVQDFGVYWTAYWLKIRAQAGRIGLVRLPAAEVTVSGGLLPAVYHWTPAGGQPRDFQPSEIVHFRGYDPGNPLLGFPPLETLRRVLAEEAAAGQYREQLWQNGARTEHVIERPVNARAWDKDQRDAFREQWQQFAGSGERAGKVPVLEDGMALKKVDSFSARDSQYLEGRKLTREEVARAYHVPLPMVGILDHATFSNIREQHKQLYQDCLGPWLVMLEEELELQLVPEFEDADQVYLEFNIREKMRGSFEEEAASLSAAVGRPWMSPNEARARVNLPQDPDPDASRLGKNLNQTTTPGQARAALERDLRSALARFWTRQRTRVEKDNSDARAERFDLARWSRELAADLRTLLGARAEAVADRLNRGTLRALELGEDAWPAGRVEVAVEQVLREGSES